METRCQWCNAPIQRKSTGRPPKFCSDACRIASHRENGGGQWFDAPSLTPDVEVKPRPTDEQVAAAVLEARTLTGSFARLATEARKPFGWRCAGMATALRKALSDNFPEVDE